MVESIDYVISTYQTKDVIARHYTKSKKNKPMVKIYIYKLAEFLQSEIENGPEDIKEHFKSIEDGFFNYFIYDMIYFTLLERICLECRLNNKTRVERGLGKKRIQGRCKEFKKNKEVYACKMHYITDQLLDFLF